MNYTIIKSVFLMRLLLTLLLTVVFFAFGPHLFAQKLVALHHAGAASFYSTPQAAYNAAVNGDTLYIPGGNFDGLSLQKSLTLIGAGHHPDSTQATWRTSIAYLNIYPGTDNSSIIGIYFPQRIFVYTGAIPNVQISRCYLNQGFEFRNTTCTGWTLAENWIANYTSNYSIYFTPTQQPSLSNFLLTNNIIQGAVNTLSLSEISNNIFLTNFVSAQNSVIKNNIFLSNFVANTSYCQWFNNVNSGVNGGPTAQNNSGSGNYLDNAAFASVFTNYVNNTSLYDNDFHVVIPGYLGTDGQPAGIYGGVYPWKEGSLPFNPHIRAQTVAPAVNPDGTLHINVTVKAQEN